MVFIPAHSLRVNLLHRCRPTGLPGLGAQVPGRAARGPAGVRVVLQGAAASRTAAHDAPAAAADGRPGRAGPPAAAPPPTHPSAQAAAGDAGRQVLNRILYLHTTAATTLRRHPGSPQVAYGGSEVKI